METRRITYTPQGGVCSKLMVIDAHRRRYRPFVWHRLSWKGNFMPGPDGTGIEAIQSMISLYPIPRIFKILIDSSFDNL